MADGLLYDSARQALWVLTLASLPGLLPALVIGLVLGLVQAATSIQEATLTFVPKLIGVFLFLMLFGGITGGLLMDFTRDMAAQIPLMTR
jgi:flagellar biosynthetic protein FliQ